MSPEIATTARVSRIECRAAALQQALAGTALAVARRPSLPILEQVLFQLADDTLTLTTTNLEVAVRWAVVGTAAAALVAGCVPFRPLHRWVQRRKPGEPLTVTLTTIGASVQVQVAGHGSRLDLDGQASSAFPTVPADLRPGETPALHFDLPALGAALPRVQYAAATTESPIPPFHSVGWHAVLGATTLQLAATDGYRGALTTIPLPVPMAGATPLAHALPLPASQVLAHLLAQIPAAASPEWGTLYLQARQHGLFVLTPAVRLLARFRPTPYPDLTTQLPAAGPTRATVDRASLQAAVATAQAALTDDLARLRLQAQPAFPGSDAQLSVTAWGAAGPGAVVTLEALVVGAAAVQALAPAYLAAALAAVPTPRVVLDFPPAGGACLVRPLPTEGATHLIMPMLL